jgi:hypothetical protein
MCCCSRSKNCDWISEPLTAQFDDHFGNDMKREALGSNGPPIRLDKKPIEHISTYTFAFASARKK